MLNINSAEEGTCLTFMLEGKVDTSTAPELEKRIESEAADADSVVLDMENLKYISSAGLRILLSLHKKMAKKGGLTLKNVNETIMEIFDFTGFADILTIE